MFMQVPVFIRTYRADIIPVIREFHRYIPFFTAPYTDNVSLEYLLTGEEKSINGNNVQGSNNVINSAVPAHVTELVDLIEELPLVKRAEAVLYLNDLKNKK